MPSRNSGQVEVQFYSYSNPTLEGGAMPPPFYTMEKIRYQLCRRLGGPGGWSRWVRKKSGPTPAFEPRTVQPVASRYTDWAIPPANLDEIYIHFWGNSKALVLTCFHSLCTMNNCTPVIHCARNTT